MAPPSTCSSRARRSPCGTVRRSSSPSASRSQATNDAGVSAASIRTRDAAGWIRSSSASKASAALGAITTSPSSTQRSGKLGLERLGELGEVAVERLEVPALGEHLVPVTEDDAPGSRPTWARTASRRRRGGRRTPSRASVPTGARTGVAWPARYRARKPGPRVAGQPGTAAMGSRAHAPDRRVERGRGPEARSSRGADDVELDPAGTQAPSRPPPPGGRAGLGRLRRQRGDARRRRSRRQPPRCRP